MFDGIPAMVQWVRNPTAAAQVTGEVWVQLWPRNFHVLQVQLKKQKPTTNKQNRPIGTCNTDGRLPSCETPSTEETPLQPPPPLLRPSPSPKLPLPQCPEKTSTPEPGVTTSVLDALSYLPDWGSFSVSEASLSRKADEPKISRTQEHGPLLPSS